MTIRRFGRAWSLILAVACLIRATSYIGRPPLPSSYSELLEGSLTYGMWAGLLILAALMIVIGVVAKCPRIRVVGHSLAVFCYITFALSLSAAAILDGQAWAGLDTLLIAVALHAERAVNGVRDGGH